MLENGAGYHDLGRLPASKAIHLSLVQELSGAPAILVRLHGAFMIIAWIGTTSLGILLARYFKQTWVGSQLCGKDQWFAVSLVKFKNSIKYHECSTYGPLMRL